MRSALSGMPLPVSSAGDRVVGSGTMQGGWTWVSVSGAIQSVTYGSGSDFRRLIQPQESAQPLGDGPDADALVDVGFRPTIQLRRSSPAFVTVYEMVSKITSRQAADATA